MQILIYFTLILKKLKQRALIKLGVPTKAAALYKVACYFGGEGRGGNGGRRERPKKQPH
jgi:hypothetical protein